MSEDKPTTTAVTPRRRRRFMISLRTMMILVLVFGGWLGWFVRRVQIQQDAVAAVKNAGGSVFYDWSGGMPGPILTDSRGFPTGWAAIRHGFPNG